MVIKAGTVLNLHITAEAIRRRELICKTVQIWHTAPLLYSVYYRLIKIIKMKLTAQEIAQIIEDYTNERSLWYDFKEWLEKKGYKVEELGLSDE